MNDPRPARRRRRKKILRRSDGSLYDVSERRPISVVELREYVRDGGFFEARREGTGADCTHEILQGVVGTGLLENLLPGVSGGPLSGLGALGALSGGGGGLGPLGNGSEALSQLARLLGDDRNHRESDRDYHDEPRRFQRRDQQRRDWWDEPRPPSRERHRDDERDALDDRPRGSGRRSSRRGWEFEDE